MLEFIFTVQFLDILVMSCACMLFWDVFLQSWYVGSPRRFWLVQLTYDDKETQKTVRGLWLASWIVAIIAAIIQAYYDPNIQHTFGWIFVQVVLNVVTIYLIAKLMALACILLERAYRGLVKLFKALKWCFMRLKNWLVNDKPLFNDAK